MVSNINHSKVAESYRPEQIIICGDFNMSCRELDQILTQSGLHRLGGPPHVFNKFSRTTYIDHVYTNVANSITLRYFESLEDRRPYGHQVMSITVNPSLRLDPTASPPITKIVTDACQFRKLWRLERSRLRAIFRKPHMDSNDLISTLYDALSTIKKSATKVTTRNVGIQ